MINDHGHDCHGHIDRCAPECDDQLPVIAKVGRGLRGDGFVVRIKKDGVAETYLEGLKVDGATGEATSEWITKNINGGQLMYQYNLRTYSRPQTFTITFKYSLPGHPEAEWTWTTPAIPYVLDGTEETTDFEDFIGIDADTLFLKNVSDSWMTESQLNTLTPHTLAEATRTQEKLLYPAGWNRSDMNAPLPGEKGTVNLTYGPGGDIDVPDWDAIAKIIGFGIDGDDLLEWVISGVGGPFDGYDTIQEYVDAKVDAKVAAAKSSILVTLQDIINKVYGGGTIGTDGHVTWNYGNDNSKIPLGNLNIFAGISSPSGNDFDNAIRSRDNITVNDLKFE